MTPVMFLLVLMGAALFTTRTLCGAVDVPYFLSVFIHACNEVDVILELAQHYIEEGVDHIFVNDDGSTDGMDAALKECLPSSYITVYRPRDIKQLPGGVYQTKGGGIIHGKRQAHINTGIYHHLLRNATEWLILVDADEFMVSRTMPERTIREILEMQRYQDCGVISIPWLLYSWGETQHTPKNRIRQSSFYRWGYEYKYEATHMNAIQKLRNRGAAGVENKVIIRTAKVRHHGELHRAYFSDHSQAKPPAAKSGLLCFPRDEAPFACAKHLTAKQVAGYSTVTQDGYWGLYQDTSGVHLDLLSQWCPFDTKMRAIESPPSTALVEEDVPHMDLIIMHYRLKSWDDWHRKKSMKLSTGYGTVPADANRLDVFDDFMVSVRAPARVTHPDFLKAAKIFESCPAKYYIDSTDNDTESVSTGMGL